MYQFLRGRTTHNDTAMFSAKDEQGTLPTNNRDEINDPGSVRDLIRQYA